MTARDLPEEWALHIALREAGESYRDAAARHGLGVKDGDPLEVFRCPETGAVSYATTSWRGP